MPALFAEISPHTLFYGTIAYLVALAVGMTFSAFLFRGSTRLIILGAIVLVGGGLFVWFFYVPSGQ